MSKIEYFHVFESIIYGLICSNLLFGLSKIVNSGQGIKIYWNHLLLCLILFILVIDNYYHGFSSPVFDKVNSSKTFFTYVVLKLIVFYFASHWLFPSNMEAANYREFFDQRRKGIYITLFIGVVIMHALSEHVTVNTGNMKVSVLQEHASVPYLAAFLIIPVFALAAFHRKLIYSEVTTLLLLIMTMGMFMRL